MIGITRGSFMEKAFSCRKHLGGGKKDEKVSQGMKVLNTVVREKSS